MAIAKVKKLYVLSHTEHRDSILEAVQDLGVVQVEDLVNSIERLSDESRQQPGISAVGQAMLFGKGEETLLPQRRTTQKTFDRLCSSIEFLQHYIPARKGLRLLREGPETVTPEEETRLLSEFEYESIVQELSELESQVKKNHARKLNLENRRENLRPWKNLDVPLSYFCRTEHTRIRALSVPVTRLDACRNAAQKATSELWFAKVGETKNTKNIVIIYHRDAQEDIERIMRDFDVHPAVFPSVDKTPLQIINEIDNQVDQIEKKDTELQQRLGNMIRQLLHLKLVANRLDNSLARKKARELCGETVSSFILKGWIAENEIPRLKQTLRAITPEVDINISDPKQGEEVPIILSNAGVIRPFEAVLDIYGKPNYREFDPTPSMALFFFIGFGYCLTDAGYGLMLALLFGIASWKLKLAPGIKKFCRLMVLSGISAVIFGALTGSWFGNLLTGADFPTTRLGLAPFLGMMQKIDPLGENIMLFLAAALVIGFFQLNWGVAIKLIHYIRLGRYWDAVCDPFSWILFSLGLVILVFNIKIGLIVSLAGLAMMLFFAGRDSNNYLLRMASGFGAIYNTLTGILSDVLSYSRLFALGLATGIMATVINIMAFILWSIPVVGWLLTILVLIVAHPLNLAINTLGAFIHTARLQFVEFFPKFYENGGRSFEPFCEKYSFMEVRKTPLKTGNYRRRT